MSATDLMEIAKAGEPERYLAALLARDDVRADLMALAAFSAELRRIPMTVSEPMVGEIRLQWWRDVMSGWDAAAPVVTGFAVSGHPVADALAATVARHQLPLAPLLAAIEARAVDLYDDPLPDLAAFEAYLQATEGGLFDLALRITAGQAAPVGLAVAAGRAFGSARMLCDLPEWLHRGRCPLPASVLASAGVSFDDLRVEALGAAARDVLAARVKDALAARSDVVRLARGLARSGRVAVLPVAVVPTLVAALGGDRRPSLRGPIRIDPLRRVIRIATAHALGL